MLVPMPVLVSAPAKVNIALRVGPPRMDGFHPLNTVFEALDIFDDIVLHEAEGEISCEVSGIPGAETLPLDERNLAVRAAHLVRDRYGEPSMGAHISITKRIPLAGGMAGGSADAAGTLVGVNKLWNLGLDLPALHELAAELGSDVPFALVGSVALGRGRGEQLEPLRVGTMHSWVLLTSHEGLSTPEVFREFDVLMGYSPVAEELVADTQELQEALAGDDVDALSAHMINDLQEAAMSLRPSLREDLRIAREHGVAAILSGSGPTIAVLCESFTHADAAAGRLARLLPHYTVVRANGPAGPAHLR